MQVVPLAAVPSQQLSVVLGQQNCQISIWQNDYGVFFSLTNNNVAVITGRIARDGVRLLDEFYFGFVGNFAFIDTQGSNDPDFSGFGSRYVLIYFEAGE